MADLRQRSIKENLEGEAKTKRAQSILIYGEQRYEFAKDVPYRTQMAANYAYGAARRVAALPLVVVQQGQELPLRHALRQLRRDGHAPYR